MFEFWIDMYTTYFSKIRFFFFFLYFLFSVDDKTKNKPVFFLFYYYPNRQVIKTLVIGSVLSLELQQVRIIWKFFFYFSMHYLTTDNLHQKNNERWYAKLLTLFTAPPLPFPLAFGGWGFRCWRSTVFWPSIVFLGSNWCKERNEFWNTKKTCF